MFEHVSPERQEAATNGIAALAQVLEHHAWERKVWGSWGQSLRAEATSLIDGKQSGVSFTREFLRSQALERMFESVFMEPMESEDRNNLLFIMKLCLLNNRIPSSDKKSSATAAPTSAVPASGGESNSPTTSSNGDLVEQICARLVKLGETFLRQTTARYEEWFHQRCTVDGSGIGTSADEVLMSSCEEALCAAVTKSQKAVATALGAIKVLQHDQLDMFDDQPLYSVDAIGATTSGGLVPLVSQDDSSFAREGNMSSFDGNGSMLQAGGTTPMSTTDQALTFLSTSGRNGEIHGVGGVHYEPQCNDVFDGRAALGVFGQQSPQHQIHDGGDTLNTDNTTTVTTTTNYTGTSSCGMFASPLPWLEPHCVAEHDAWAKHMCWRAVQKTREVSREINRYIQNQQYDEEVRYRIEEQFTAAKELLPELAALFQRVDAYTKCMDQERENVRATHEAQTADITNQISGELKAQDKLQKRLRDLEEEARQVRELISKSESAVIAHNNSIDDLQRNFMEHMCVFDRRLKDIVRAGTEVAAQKHISTLVVLFLTGLTQKSADQTAKHLKSQETVIEQQWHFAVEQSEDAVRRLGVVVSMLDASRSVLKDYYTVSAAAGVAAAAAPSDATLADARAPGDLLIPQETHDVTMSSTSTATSGAPPPQQSPSSLHRHIASLVDDLGKTLFDRVERARDVSRHIEVLSAKLDECGFQAYADDLADSLASLRKMCDAVDFAAVGLVPSQLTAELGSTTNAPPQPTSGMASRVHSSAELLDAAGGSTVLLPTTSSSDVPATPGSATKRKCGIPIAMRKRVRPPKPSAPGADLTAASAFDGLDLPARVKSISTEVERLLHPMLLSTTGGWKQTLNSQGE